MKSISKARLSDPTTDRVVSQTIDGVNFLLQNSLILTTKISVTFSGAGSKAVSHGLNKPVSGWIVIDRNSAATLYKTASDSQTITLQASAAGIFSLIIF